MSQSMNTSLSSYQTRLTMLMHKLQRLYHGFRREPIPDLLLRVEEAETSAQLTDTVNCVQKRLWKLPEQEQILLRSTLCDALNAHILQGSRSSLREEAAGWLRLLTQAGLVTQPQEVFVTLVTAATRSNVDDVEKASEQQAYLKMIFDCFWPFRYPYPAFSWQMFPGNEVFYPLASLLDKADVDTQDILIAIFAELPALDDPEITEHLLPVALAWSTHADIEHRRRIADVLARMNVSDAQEALHRLETDHNPAVRASARQATAYIYRA